MKLSSQVVCGCRVVPAPHNFCAHVHILMCKYILYPVHLQANSCTHSNVQGFNTIVHKCTHSCVSSNSYGLDPCSIKWLLAGMVKTYSIWKQ